MVHDNLLDLNLLRSPSNPDPDADMGAHSFTYSLFPHAHSLIESDTIRESSCLNQEPIIFEGVRSSETIPVQLKGEGLDLTVLKKAEKEDCLIVRIVETHGRKSEGSLVFNGKARECNLMEWENIAESVNIDGEMPLCLSPFEIKTFKIYI